MTEELNETLPCGCAVATREVDGNQIFVMIPCRVDCKSLAYVVLEAKRADKPVEFRRI